MVHHYVRRIIKDITDGTLDGYRKYEISARVSSLRATARLWPGSPLKVMITIHFSWEALESYIKANVCPLKWFVNDKEEKLILRTSTQKKKEEKKQSLSCADKSEGWWNMSLLSSAVSHRILWSRESKDFLPGQDRQAPKPMGNVSRLCFLFFSFEQPLKFPQYSIFKDLNYTIQKSW